MASVESLPMILLISIAIATVPSPVGCRAKARVDIKAVGTLIRDAHLPLDYGDPQKLRRSLWFSGCDNGGSSHNPFL